MRPHLVSLFLALSLAIPSAFAQYHEGSTDGLSVSSQLEDIEKTVADAAHYVGLVADAVSELDKVDSLSGKAISRRVARQVREKLTLAIELMATIIEDPELTEDQKAKFTFDLASSIGEVVLTIVRHQGEDQIEPPTSYTKIERLSSVLREIMLDLKAVAPRTSALYGEPPEGANRWQRFWHNTNEAPLGLLERLNRDREARAAFEMLEEFGRQSLPELGEDSPLRKAHRDFWTKEIVERTLKIREARRVDKKWATGVYYGLAAYVLLAPPVDLLGLLGGRSDNSLFMSSMLYTSFWVMVGTSKMRSVADKTVQLAKNLADILNTPVADLVGNPADFIHRLKNIARSPDTVRTCSEFLEQD